MNRFITEDKVELNPSTRIFKGYENRLKADEQATKQRSYIFQVYKETTEKDNTRTMTFFGWGIPH